MGLVWVVVVLVMGVVLVLVLVLVVMVGEGADLVTGDSIVPPAAILSQVEGVGYQTAALPHQ